LNPSKKIICIVGARPQFIKHAPMELALNKYFEVQTIHTGQHYDEKMSAIFFEELKITPPNYALHISSRLPSDQLAKMLIAISDILQKEKPDAVLVYGDTTSTLAGALAADQNKIPLIHIEAGLRSFNKEMPEENNRILTDHLSSLLFCPTEISIENLEQEGITENVFKSGDVMSDMLQLILPHVKKTSSQNKYYLCTIHRPYNTDDKKRLSTVLNTLNRLDKKVVFPMHPRTKQRCKDFGIDLLQFSNISVMPPLSYLELIEFAFNAKSILTDSGGLQKEAYLLKKQCITVRPETEWVETLEGGWNNLVFEKMETILSILNTPPQKNQYKENIYGDGKAAQSIAKTISNHLS